MLGLTGRAVVWGPAAWLAGLGERGDATAQPPAGVDRATSARAGRALPAAAVSQPVRDPGALRALLAPRADPRASLPRSPEPAAAQVRLKPASHRARLPREADEKLTPARRYGRVPTFFLSRVRGRARTRGHGARGARGAPGGEAAACRSAFRAVWR